MSDYSNLKKSSFTYTCTVTIFCKDCEHFDLNNNFCNYRKTERRKNQITGLIEVVVIESATGLIKEQFNKISTKALEHPEYFFNKDNNCVFFKHREEKKKKYFWQ